MKAFSKKYHWLIRYKLYHIPFWFLYHFTLWTVLTGSPAAVMTGIFNSPYSIKFFFYIILQTSSVYFNLYFLIPRFLERAKYAEYILLAILTTVATAICIVPGYYLSAFLSGKSLQELYNVTPRSFWYFFQTTTLPSTVAAMSLGMSVKLAKSWLESRRKEQLLLKEKVETELNFLKAQLNPHFLFNTINSIFVLIHKNPDMASESLARFSDLMRHQLYECDDAEISVDKEIAYLENFIALERLRQEKNITIDVNFSRQYPEDGMIAPFILLPFIENAFKHVSKRKDQENWIKMDVKFEGVDLVFSISNSVDVSGTHSMDHSGVGGIGLKNVLRRLDLIYPSRYRIDIGKPGGRFEVSLRVRLKADTQPSRTSATEPSLVLQ